MGPAKAIDLQSIVGRGYADFWHWRGRYRVCKGSRASKKSKTAALWYIFGLLKHPQANLLVVRKVFRTLKDSCFTELKWAMQRLGVAANWKVTESPLEMMYLPTGQKIYFRGLDSPLKTTSIAVGYGSLCWLWVEEAYEIPRREDFAILDECIRGEVAPGLFKQCTLTFNPWNEKHWIKQAFFDSKDDEVLTKTTDYLCNEWLDKADLKAFERMRLNSPRRYRVAGLGEWGVAEGLIFENWEEREFNLEEVRKLPGIKSAFGLDFGYTNDPSALFCGLIDLKAKEIYVFDELYRRGMSNEAIFTAIDAMGYRKERIIADSAEPKSIARLRTLGLYSIRSARKGPDSVRAGIDFLQGFKIIIHPKCVNFITEISSYVWEEDKLGHKLNRPEDSFNHLMDAMRYAVEEHSKPQAFAFV